MSDGLAFPFAVAVSLTLIGVDTAVTLMPKPSLDAFFKVDSVTAERVDDTAVLKVDRQILRPLHMTFSVRVKGNGAHGWVDFCGMSSGVILYEPDAELPDPVTLDWWTWGECPTLPPGQARIVTTWAPDSPALEPLTVITEVNQ